MPDPTREPREPSTQSTPTRRRFLAATAAGAASLGLSGSLIPRMARAAIGLDNGAPRLLGYEEVPLPPAVQEPFFRLATLLKGEGYEVVPKAYEIAYTVDGSKRTITRVLASTSSGDRAAAVVATKLDAAAYIETMSGGSVDHFRLFLADRPSPRETARLTFSQGRVASIKAVEDAAHSTRQLEWMGKLIAIRGTDRENCYCCAGCCYPSDRGGFLCDLGGAVACSAGGQISSTCSKSPYTAIACGVGCFILFDALCGEGKTQTSCDSCSRYCSTVYGMKPRCCPGETCGHAGCYNG